MTTRSQFARPGLGRRRRVLSSVLATGLAGTIALIGVGAASASVPAKTMTPLQKGEKALAGKTISLIIPSTAGSPYDVDFRAQAAQMSTFLHASVNVVDNSTGAGVAGQDQLAHAAPDGTTIGLYNLGQYFYDQVTNQVLLNFNPAKVPVIGVPSGFPLQILYALPSLAAQTIPQMQTSATPIKVCMYNTLVNIDTALFLRSFGIKNFSYVVGYSSGTAEWTGFLRGDCSLIVASPGIGASAINANSVKVVAVMQGGTSLKSYSPQGVTLLNAFPTTAQLIKQYPPKTALEKKATVLMQQILSVPNSVLGAPPRTPVDVVDALSAAEKYAMTVPSVIQLFRTSYLPGTYQAGTLTKSLFLTGLDKVKAVQSLVGTTF